MEASIALRPLGSGAPKPWLRVCGDEKLVALLRAGENAAFEAIFDRHHRPVLAFARHMLGDHQEAEDVVQHTFFAAYRDLVGTDRPYHLRAWLFTIARNRCLSVLRARRESANLDDFEPSTEGLASHVERRDDLRAMLGDLARLPSEQREALLLAELGALEHVAVAAVLDVPKDKVKALVYQARTTLSAEREARETSCADIRSRLATASGGELRKGLIRRHLRECDACATFRDEVAHQRRALAALMPVVPSAGLKTAALSGILGGGAALAGSSAGGGSLGGGVISALGAKSAASKGLAIAALAGTSTAGGVAAVDVLRAHEWAARDALAQSISESGRASAPLTAMPTPRAHRDASGRWTIERAVPGARDSRGAGRGHGATSATPGSAGARRGQLASTAAGVGLAQGTSGIQLPAALLTDTSANPDGDSGVTYPLGDAPASAHPGPAAGGSRGTGRNRTASFPSNEVEAEPAPAPVPVGPAVITPPVAPAPAPAPPVETAPATPPASDPAPTAPVADPDPADGTALPADGTTPDPTPDPSPVPDPGSVPDPAPTADPDPASNPEPAASPATAPDPSAPVDGPDPGPSAQAGSAGPGPAPSPAG